MSDAFEQWKSTQYAIIDALGNTVITDATTALRWQEEEMDRAEQCGGVPLWRIGETVLDDDHSETVRISTVFSVNNLGYPGHSPLRYETLIEGGKFDGDKQRYATRDEAADGHRIAVQRVYTGQS